MSKMNRRLPLAFAKRCFIMLREHGMEWMPEQIVDLSEAVAAQHGGTAYEAVKQLHTRLSAKANVPAQWKSVLVIE